MDLEIGCFICFYVGKFYSMGSFEWIQFLGMYNVCKGKMQLLVN